MQREDLKKDVEEHSPKKKKKAENQAAKQLCYTVVKVQQNNLKGNKGGVSNNQDDSRK